MSGGTLYLIPVPLGDAPPALTISENAIACVRRIAHFGVENARSARAHLKAFAHPMPLREITIVEIAGDDAHASLAPLVAALRGGADVGLMSEAGCPGVADPGRHLVALAHAGGIRVVPLVGPSSLLLAIMASGLNGQQFSFHGYLPVKEEARIAALRRIEDDSRRNGALQLFIETPYRNDALFASVVANCRPTTRLCIASELTLPGESIHSASIADWRSRAAPALDRRPTVFLIQAS